jgi:LPS O-antigen subunit length determinant protein (WzzB/FepE family)
MAVENWQRETNTLVIDPKIYDEKSTEWVRDVSYPKAPEPSSWETYEEFSELLSISQDKDTGMVTLSMEYYSPEVAIQWLDWLVDEINTEIREQDKTEAQNSINFLRSKLEKIQLADMQNVFYQLIEEQTKTIMLAEVSKEYVLKTIDPANAPDDKAKPKRALIVVLGTMLGGMLSVLIVLVRYFSNKSE